MIVVSVIEIILAFAVLIFAAYKKISMFLAAVLAAAIVALFGGLDVAASLVGADGLPHRHEGLRGQLAGDLRPGRPAGRAV
ncbi:MAG: hypothetical protein ACLTYN_09265 [Dysosmobacter welbionis]